MVYSDGVHIVADTIEELHEYCASVGIKRCWFEGVRKGHPHYDLPFSKSHKVIFGKGQVQLKSSREILAVSKKLMEEIKKYKYKK